MNTPVKRVDHDIFKVGCRHELGHCLRKHGFPGARRADHQHVPFLACGFLDYLYRVILPNDLVDELGRDGNVLCGLELAHNIHLDFYFGVSIPMPAISIGKQSEKFLPEFFTPSCLPP